MTRKRDSKFRSRRNGAFIGMPAFSSLELEGLHGILLVHPAPKKPPDLTATDIATMGRLNWRAPQRQNSVSARGSRLFSAIELSTMVSAKDDGGHYGTREGAAPQAQAQRGIQGRAGLRMQRAGGGYRWLGLR